MAGSSASEWSLMWAILIAASRDSPCRRCLGEGGEEVPGGERVVGCRKASNSVGDDSQKFVGATVVSIP